MGIILKHTLKNIFKKPLRTLLVVFCVMVCSLAALLTFDMSGALENIVRSYGGTMFGTTDIIIEGKNLSLDILDIPEMPEATVLPLCIGTSDFYKRVEGEYSYIHMVSLGVYCMNTDIAKEMDMISYDADLKEDEIILSIDFAEEFDYHVGDEIIIHDVFDEPVTFTVVQIVDYNDKGIMANNSGVIGESALPRIYKDVEPNIIVIVIDIKDNSKVREITNILKEANPLLSIEAVYDNEQMDEVIGQITSLFVILFVVCMLMVIFVTISVSERIVCERMSVVGTLRSLGISSGMTTGCLLLENILYGLFGSILGCNIYKLIRVSVLGSFINPDIKNQVNFGDTSIGLIIAIIVFAIIIECLCPIKEIIKAVKTPIRDIIFSNKDTEYVQKKSSIVIGIIFGVIGVVCLLSTLSLGTAMLAIISLLVMLGLLFPVILRFFAGLLYKLFEKMNKPVAMLAATMVKTKKNTIGSAVLMITATSLAIVIFSVSESLGDILEKEVYASDIILDMSSYSDDSNYSYIENLDGVEDLYYMYAISDKINIADQTFEMLNVLSITDGYYDYITGIEGLPESLSDNEVYIDSVLAQKLNVNVGEEVEIIFEYEGYLPLKKTFVIAGFMDAYNFDSSRTDIFVNAKVFEEVMGKYYINILVNVSDDADVDYIKEMILKYSAGYVNHVYTNEEYIEMLKTESAGLIGVINLVIYIGVGLSFIGSVSNLLIGFEGRKRECAVLYSTAMDRKKIGRMLYLESFITSGITLLIAFPMGLLMTYPISAALNVIGAGIQITIMPTQYISFVLVLWVVFTLTAIFPNRVLKKMKIAEQLKYE